MSFLLFVLISQSQSLQLEPIPGVNPRAELISLRAKLCDVPNVDEYLACLQKFKIGKGRKGLGYEWLFEKGYRPATVCIYPISALPNSPGESQLTLGCWEPSEPESVALQAGLPSSVPLLQVPSLPSPGLECPMRLG